MHDPGVLPTLTTCLVLWAYVAGFDSSVPPETSQSKHLLMAERCCLTDGRESGSCSTYAATWMGLMVSSRWSPRCSHQSRNREIAPSSSHKLPDNGYPVVVDLLRGHCNRFSREFFVKWRTAIDTHSKDSRVRF